MDGEEECRLLLRKPAILDCSLARSLSEDSVVGPRVSVFSPGKDGEVGDVCFIVDTRVQAGEK
jgi:hypothetical protein